MAVTAINIENSRNQHILLNTTGNIDDGSLKVLATDGDYVYFTELTQKNVGKCKVNPDESLEIFKGALKAVLVPLSKDQSLGTGKESSKRWSAVAEVHTGEYLVITVREQIEGGLSVKVGEIHLDESSENHQVVLFDWTVESCQETQYALDKLDEAKATFQSVQDASNMLNQQLNDLTSAKRHHDQQVMDKFLKILNEKKKRIAFLERQLISAHEGQAQDSDSRPSKRSLVQEEEEEEIPEIKSENDLDQDEEAIQDTPSPNEEERTPSDSEG